MELQIIKQIVPEEVFPALKTATLSGDVDPLIIKRNIKAIETIVKSFNADNEIKTAIEQQIDLHGKTADVYGAKFSIVERPSYEYSMDETWSDLQQQIEVLKIKQKERENILKASSGTDKDFVDQTTGEVVVKVPKQVSRVINVSLNK